jgi:signal transduction histidine kinase
MNPAMKQLFDSVHDGILLVGRDGGVKFASTEACRLLGVKRVESLPAPMLKHLEGVIGNYLSLPDRFEYVAPESRDADSIEVTLLGSPVGSDLVFVLHNATQAKLYQTTVDNVFHLINKELRYPMQDFLDTLGNILERLKEHDSEDAVISAVAARARDNGTALMAKMRKLIEMTDLIELAPVVGSDRIELKVLVEELLLAVKDRAGNQRQRIYLAGFEETLPPVYGSRPWLARALMEFLGNSLAHAKRGSAILVSARKNGSHVIFGVRNYGHALPAHLRERVFLPFYRAHSVDEQPGAGLGLGLPLAKHVVEMHGGHVRIEGGEGGFTEFLLELPTGAPHLPTHELGLAQAERYARDLAQLMARAGRRQAAVN